MLSDFSALPFDRDIPILSERKTPPPEQDSDPLVSLNFDDLLDIAREFEFTRTITHIWPCEEPSACHETGLDELLAAIVPTSNAEECPLPLPSSAPPTTIAPFHIQEVDLNNSASRHPVPDTTPTILREPESIPWDADQGQAAMTALASDSTLRGWSPPNGSQFVDLDDTLMLPQPQSDMWNSPWLAMLLAASSMPPQGNADQSATGDSQPQTTESLSKLPPANTTNKADIGPKKKSVPTTAQSSPRAILEPVRVRSATHTNSEVASHSLGTPLGKLSKSRPRSAPVTNGTSTAHYGRAPRGGIPPHIARSVTQANILRIEKERKVMQDSFVSTTAGAAKKPSVLRKVAHEDRETNKRINGGGGGKKILGRDENAEKESRVTKRARV